MTTIEVIALTILFCWLAFEAAWDLRDRRIPIWFSLVMLIPGAIWLATCTALWAVVLIAISLISTELYNRFKVIGLIGIFAPLPLIYVVSPECLTLALGWGVLVALWLLGVVGGADALAGLSLLLFFPSWAMFVSILAGIIVWGLAVLFWRHGKNIGLRLWVAQSARTGEKLPGIGAYALAVLFYWVAQASA